MKVKNNGNYGYTDTHLKFKSVHPLEKKLPTYNLAISIESIYPQSIFIPKYLQKVYWRVKHFQGLQYKQLVVEYTYFKIICSDFLGYISIMIRYIF